MIEPEILKEYIEVFEPEGMSFREIIVEEMRIPNIVIEDHAFFMKETLTIYAKLCYPLLLCNIIDSIKQRFDLRAGVRPSLGGRWFFQYSTSNGNYDESQDYDSPILAREACIEYNYNKLKGDSNGST